MANTDLTSLSIEQIAPNFTKVWIQGSGWIAFSYRTIIAFAINGKVTVRQNDWKTTTGKHLNQIDGGGAEAKAARLTSADFEASMAEHEISFRRVFAGLPEKICSECGEAFSGDGFRTDDICSPNCAGTY